jgi:HD superfamily phosphohydrolase
MINRVPRKSIRPRDLTLLDPLYGTIESNTSKDLRTCLYQTRPMARLRDISLSSVPSEMLPTGQPSSRFEHSAGVGHLGAIISLRPEFAPWRNELIVSCMFHDTGSVPFSHAAEIFQYDLTGRTHEQAAADALASPDVANILSFYDVDADRVLALILGEHPELGGLLAGSIDLDNLDNSARLLRALGGAKEPPYSPEQILGAFVMHDGQLALDSSYVQQLAGWKQCRQMLYTGLLYHPDTLAASSMLYRALETVHAAGLLGTDFFEKGEGAALAWLRSEAVPVAASELIEAASDWRFYEHAMSLAAETEADRRAVLQLASDWRERKSFTDDVAEALGLAPEHVAVHAGRDKGAKSIDLPFVGADAEACAMLFRKVEERYSLHVFTADALPTRTVEQAVHERLDRVEGVDHAETFM